MEVGRNSDGLTLSGFGSGVTEDDYEGRGTGTSPSLAPFLARLSRDECLGWTTTRARADDTESLSVNVSDCGSCHLSEVSSVSSWLNDASAVDDDYSSCAPDDETGSEKDDVDEDDNGPEIRPLFLLQRCLEEKLLEQQQSGDVTYSAVSTKSCEVSVPQNDEAEVETGTIKRASQNLFTFKSSETADNHVPAEGYSVSDINGVITSRQSMPLRSSGSRCNPDSVICTGALYDFNSSSNKGDSKSVKSEVVNGSTSDAAEDGQCHVSIQPPKHMHKPQCSNHGVSSFTSEVPFIKNTSPVKDAVETPLCFATLPKHNFPDKSALDVKLAGGGSEQNTSAVGLGISHIASGSVYSKQINHSSFSNCNSNNFEGISLKANHSSCQSMSLTDCQCSSHLSIKSKHHQETLPSCVPDDKSMTVVPVEGTKIKTSGEASAENVDATSVISDEAEKASDHALVMPMVEDGLSNSDISDVDEAFSMFAGLKPPESVPVDTSFGAKSPVANDANNKTTNVLDGNTADAHSIQSL